MNQIRIKIEKLLENQLGIKGIKLEIPPESDWGDFSLPCFQFSKELKLLPNKIAEKFKEIIKDNLISKTEIKGPYLNIHLNKKEVMKDIFSPKKAKKKSKKKEKVLIEYLSANPNKPLHLGQARNICIGDSLVKISKYLGYETHAGTYGDDSGVNVGYNLVGHLYYNYPLKTDKKFDHYSGEIYMSMKKREEEGGENFKKQISSIISHIEKNDNLKISKLHKEYTRRCAIAQFESCWKINSFFDFVTWETDILKLGFFKETIEKLKSMGFVKFADKGEAKGCWILDLSEEEEFKNTRNPYQILIRSDGTITYPAKDIVYAIWKLGFLDRDFFYKKLVQQSNKDWIFTTSSEKKESEKKDFGNYDRAIAVVDNRQTYAQNVVKTALKMLGYLKGDKKYHHLAYGVVYLTPQTLIDFEFNLTEKEKKQDRLPFSSRKGWFVTIDGLFDMLIEKIKSGSENKEISHNKIAMGVIRFDFIKTDIQQDIVFDLDKAIDLKGDTGMYVLYTFARISSIFEKAGSNIAINKIDNNIINNLNENLEWEIIKEISKKEEIIEEAFESLRPNILAQYLINISRLFNSYYEKHSIIKSEESIKISRLFLLRKIKETMREVMILIGMEELDKI